MNRFSFRRRRPNPTAFTLVELLVVIAIIAILAAVSLSVGATVIKAAKRAKAANTATQIQTACLGYYTEYSVYPIPTTPAATASQDYSLTDASTSAAGWKNLIYGLCGNINPYDSTTTAPSGPAPNTRGIAFLNLKTSDVDSNGGPQNPLPPSTANPYFNIVLDNDYDNIIGDTGSVQCINFTGAVNGTAPSAYASGKGPTGGVAVWANCNGSTTLQNPNFWVRTY